MDYIIAPFPVAASIFLGMLICMEIGRHLGMRKLAEDPEKTISGLSTAGGAVFALYGLLIALTLSGAPSRLDTRRQLIAEEANAIGTAYLRLDLLPADAQPAMRELFRKYMDSRLEVYRKLPDVQAARSELARSAKLQNDIWSDAVAATRLPSSHPDTGRLLLPALNEMIDITTTRTVATMIHPPLIIFVLLALLALVCSLLAGYDMAACKQRSWLHVLAFAFIMALSVYAILEIEFPRAGIVRMQAYDQMLIDVRGSMQ
jgi:ABC-type glycerol-3-phosphate transport system permease component